MELITKLRILCFLSLPVIRCSRQFSRSQYSIGRNILTPFKQTIPGCKIGLNAELKHLRRILTDGEEVIYAVSGLGPFVFNYLANIIRAKDSITKRTDLASLQKKLLRGSPFSNISAIGQDGLQQLYDLLVSGISGLEYKPAVAFSKSSESISEREVLEARKLKHENALSRLHSLYLYGDGSMSEKDFVIEKQRISNSIDEINKKLLLLNDSNAYGPLADDEFIEKASYFIMVSKLLDDSFVDYEKYIRQIDPSIPRSFIRTVIDRISVANGIVTSITFKNGMTHTFFYGKTQIMPV